MEKEEAVDNRQWAISEYYKSGWRAYQNFDGGKVLYKDGVYHHTIASGHHSEAGKWHSIRAYQDEQRKKGVPIILNQQQAEDWCLTDDTNGFYFRQVDMRPEIIVEDGYNGPAFGRFTNFRWRAGYPKGGDHGH